MASTSGHNSSFKAAYHTTAITGGSIGATTTMGNIAPGSISVDRQENVQSGSGVSVSVGATRRISLNILGDGSVGTWLATLQTAKNANPPTTHFLYITNIGLSGYTIYGPGNWETGHRKGKGGDAERQSVMCVFYCEGDTAEDIEVEDDNTVTGL